MGGSRTNSPEMLAATSLDEFHDGFHLTEKEELGSDAQVLVCQ
jgi:hypothetical protein